MEKLREALNDCRLIDFGSSKHEMTWRGRGIMERLDRALCCKYWIEAFSSAKVDVLDWLCSNHRPIVVAFEGHILGDKCGMTIRNTRFHFEEVWCEDDKCREVISNYWEKGGQCLNS